MKARINKLNLSIFFFLLFALPLGAFSQVTAYLCGSAQADLTPNFGTYVPVNGDQIIWSEVGNATPVATYTYGTNGPAFKTPANLSDGEHKYTVQIVPAALNSCPGEVSDEYVIYKLPSTTFALNAPVDSYCTELSTTSEITATPAILPPTGVTLDYTWSATLGGAAVLDVTTLGTASGNKFTMNSNIATGTYVFSATAKYNTGSTPIIPSVSCTINGSNTQQITVTAKPGKPSVTVTAAP